MENDADDDDGVGVTFWWRICGQPSAWKDVPQPPSALKYQDDAAAADGDDDGSGGDDHDDDVHPFICWPL